MTGRLSSDRHAGSDADRSPFDQYGIPVLAWIHYRDGSYVPGTAEGFATILELLRLDMVRFGNDHSHWLLTPYGRDLVEAVEVGMFAHQIELTRGYRALVDCEDVEMVSRYVWAVSPRQASGHRKRFLYASARPRGGSASDTRRVLMHRVIAGSPTGLVDHRNGDTLDNRRLNLRVANWSTNQGNRRSIHGASRFKGVFRNRNGDKWQAQIRVNYEKRYLGTFVDEEEAARVYDAAALTAWGEFAALNFPAPEPKVHLFILPPERRDSYPYGNVSKADDGEPIHIV